MAWHPKWDVLPSPKQDLLPLVRLPAVFQYTSSFYPQRGNSGKGIFGGQDVAFKRKGPIAKEL